MKTIKFIDGPWAGKELKSKAWDGDTISIPALDRVVKYPPSTTHPDGFETWGTHVYTCRSANDYAYVRSTGEPRQVERSMESLPSNPGAVGISSTYKPRTEPLCRITDDGKVTLASDIDLTQVKSLGKAYLLLLREMVNTAIYDLENGK